jgi:hypothetical protein
MRAVFSHMLFKIRSVVASLTIERKQWVIKLCQKQNKRALMSIRICISVTHDANMRPLVVRPLLQIDIIMPFFNQIVTF